MASSLFLPAVTDVSEAVTVKNTFLDDWVTPSEAPKRRCSSVPRSWAPSEFCMDSSCGKSVEGEGSTTASNSSDKDSLAGSDSDFFLGAGTPRSSSISDFDCLESDAESTMEISDMAAEPKETLKPVVEVKLLDFVEDAAPPPPPPPPPPAAAPAARTKLRATAQPFAAAGTPPSGIQRMIQAVKEVLETDPSVIGVQMIEGAMGGTCTMVVQTDGPHKNLRQCLASAKTALLTSAEHSQDTYLMGYEANPITKIDKFSFSATLANIPASQHGTACWDSYKHGFCPRRMTCRWTHPCENQVMRLVIRAQRSSEASPVKKNEKSEKNENSPNLKFAPATMRVCKQCHEECSSDFRFCTSCGHDNSPPQAPVQEFPDHLAMLQRCAMALSTIATTQGIQTLRSA